jgi:aminoglycoside 6-adenylyltransferase
MHTDAFGRGTRILFDRAIPANAGRFVRRPMRPRHPITEQELTDHLHRTWMEALRAAKLIRRRDLFRAVRDVNTTLKQRLLIFAEWHAQTLHGAQADIWYNGRHLDQWADPRLLAALPETVAGYDADSLTRALDRTLDTVRWLAREIADRRGFVYPEEPSRKFWSGCALQRTRLRIKPRQPVISAEAYR